MALGELDRAPGLAGIQRALIFAGAGGSICLVLAGFGRVLFNDRIGGDPLLLIIILPLWILVGGWLLWPYRGAWKLQRRSRTRAEGVVLILALLLMIALAANSFLATSAFVGGKLHPTADGVTIILIPMVQWVMLALADLLPRIARGVLEMARR